MFVPLPDMPRNSLQTGGLTLRRLCLHPTKLEGKLGRSCDTGNIIFHCGISKFQFYVLPGICKIIKIHSASGSCGRKNTLSLVGTGFTRPLLRNSHNHPGGIFPAGFCFPCDTESEPPERYSLVPLPDIPQNSHKRVGAPAHTSERRFRRLTEAGME